MNTGNITNIYLGMLEKVPVNVGVKKDKNPKTA
jgi:hypothetical protein